MNRTDSFQKRLQAALDSIGQERLAYNQQEAERYAALYDYIEEYAQSRELFQTSLALPIARALLDGMYRGWIPAEDGTMRKMPYINHCLTVCRMLIDLHIPLDPEQEDRLLACGLTHDLIGHSLGKEKKQQLLEIYHLDPWLYETAVLLDGEDYSRASHRDELDMIWESGNRIAIIVKMVDCSCIIEQLYNAPVRVAKEYIYQARMHFLPKCIEIKREYPELFSAAAIIMEKIRTLSDVIEILVSKYETRETELNHEWLALRDENVSMLRKIEQDRLPND